MSILNVSNLVVEYETEQHTIRAVDNIDFDIDSERTLGIVGECDSGKDAVAKAILGILDDNGSIGEGGIYCKE